MIFVDGDFWHGNHWKSRRARLAAGANAPYWIEKIAANMRRDRRWNAELARLGWLVIRVWESEVKADPGACARSIERVIAARARRSLRPAPELRGHDIRGQGERRKRANQASAVKN